MKISPVSSAANPAGDPQVARVQSVRSMRMNTNATPGRIDAPAAPVPAPDAKLPISDTNDPVEGTVEVTQPLSPQAAALARQRRALQVKERELAEREKAISGQSPVQGDAIDMARLRSEPLSVLLEAGVTYDQLTEAILANQSGSGPEIQALKAELRALKEGVDKTLTDRDANAEKAVLAEMQREATKLAGEGDNFELVRETGSIPQVMQLIERTYRETGEVLDVQEAMQLIEDELITEASKLAALKKVQGRLQPEPAAPAPLQQQRPMRTLTNRDTAAVPMGRKERALLAFTGQLKK